MSFNKFGHVPFSCDTEARLPGETRLVELIREWLGAASPAAPRGIGDDCAVLPARRFPGKRITTTDCVIRGRHFDDTISPRDVGKKLVNRNLSDIAAMGGTPSDALLALVCGENISLPWLEAFFRGVAEACLVAGVELSGGDCAQGPPDFFCATLALTGFASRPLLRTSARAGDTIAVTGYLGETLASGWHHRFTPRLAEGRWLASRTCVRAAMDISDGLAKDLPALLPNDCDALLFPEQIPIRPKAECEIAADGVARKRESEVSREDEISKEDAVSTKELDDFSDTNSPLYHALCDGEDYELLLALDTPRLPRLLAAWKRKFPSLPLTPIGRVVPATPATPARRIFFSTPPPRPPILFSCTGYEHFCSPTALRSV